LNPPTMFSIKNVKKIKICQGRLSTLTLSVNRSNVMNNQLNMPDSINKKNVLTVPFNLCKSFMDTVAVNAQNKVTILTLVNVHLNSSMATKLIVISPRQ